MPPAGRAQAGGDGLFSASADQLYEAVLARDARFDGRLFIGVTSTGIYCRPVCRVRTPRAENCRYFPNAASAECAGFRPCLRCRPELAPGLSLMDSSRVLATQASRLIDAAVRAGHDVSLACLALRLGVTERHLRRIFQEAHGVAPVDYLATRRLLQAKQLLTDTRWPIAQVALASGFSSVRRFNAAFSERYRLKPGDLRRDAGSALPPALAGHGELVVRLAWRPPFDAAGLLAFYARRALPGIESIDGTTLRRTLSLTHQGRTLDGWIEGRLRVPGRRGALAPHAIEVRMAPELTPALGEVLQRVRLAFDLDADPQALGPVLRRVPGAGTRGRAAGMVRSDEGHGPHAAGRPAVPRPLAPPGPAARTAAAAGTRLPGAFDPFETAVRIVLGQQVTVAAARTLAARLVQRFARPVRTPFEGLDRLFPDAATLADAPAEAIGSLGIVRQRVGALQALARAVRDGQLLLDGSQPVAATLEALQALPGIGPWTAQMVALRVLSWPDAFPASDIGVLQALGTRSPAEAEALSEAWRPWRSYAVIRLWQTLETPA